jgi:hypothetical protein
MIYKILSQLSTHDLGILGTYWPDSFVNYPLYSVDARRVTTVAEGGR